MTDSLVAASHDAVKATLALIEFLDGPRLFSGGDTDSRSLAEKRDMAHGRAIALNTCLTAASKRYSLLWPEKRDLIHAILKSLEETEVLLPTTNADIEFGKWLKTQERDDQGGN